MADHEVEFRFFQGIHVRTDIKINIFHFIRSMTTKFGKQVRTVMLIQMRLIKQAF